MQEACSRSKDWGPAEKTDEEADREPFEVVERKGLQEPDVSVLRGSGLREDLERGIHPSKGRFV